jgi:hypothetical protein
VIERFVGWARPTAMSVGGPSPPYMALIAEAGRPGGNARTGASARGYYQSNCSATLFELDGVVVH